MADNRTSGLLTASLVGIISGYAAARILSSSTFSSKGSKPTDLLKGDGKLKLEYFDIAGRAEPIRLALFMYGVDFDDIRLQFKDWKERKKTAKYGQLPLLTLPDGRVFSQSEAMLRWAGTLDDSSLYPDDAEKRFLIEEAMGLATDLDRAWLIPMYIGITPEVYGYSSDAPKEERNALTKRMRENFVDEVLPNHMNRIADIIEDNGGKYMCGDDLTIADLHALPKIAYFQKGIADYVPKDCLDKFPVITSWIQNVYSHPKVAAYFAR